MKKLSEFEPNTGGVISSVNGDRSFLERTGVIRKVDTSGKCGHNSCEGCTSCGGGKTCSGCMPEDGFQNMGSRWEVL